MKLGQDYWEERYLNKATGWDLGRISQPLRSIIDIIKNKSIKILIPGAGNSYEAIYLYDSGFENITILDIALPPILELRKRFNEDSRVRIVHEDFFKHDGRYDLILEQTFLCALEPRLRESYCKKAHELLNENGSLKGVLFDFDAERIEPPYPASRLAYQKLFEKHFEIMKLEKCFNSEISRKGKELIINLKRK